MKIIILAFVLTCAFPSSFGRHFITKRHNPVVENGATSITFGIPFVVGKSPNDLTPSGSQIQSSGSVVVSGSTFGNGCSDGTSSSTNKPCKCFDRFGIAKSDGELWTEGYWQMICESGRRKIKGCIASQHANHQIIPVGKVETINGFWHNCSINETWVRYQEEPSCSIGGKVLHLGETFNRQNFKMVCKKWGYDIQACIFVNKQNKSFELKVGEELIDGIQRYVCSNDSSTPGRVKFYTEQIACIKNGLQHKINETWIEKGFKYECKKYGAISILNCVASDGNAVEIGESQIVNGITRKCFRSFNTVHYQEYTCTTGPCDMVAVVTTVSPLTTSKSVALTTKKLVTVSENCIQNGKSHPEGTTWSERLFKYQCKNGRVNIIACIANDDSVVTLGQVVVVDGYRRECYRQGFVFGLKEEFCGQSCTSGNSNSKPAPIHGKKTCSFGSARVYNVGDEWVVKHFKFRCTNNGPEAIACISPVDRVEVPMPTSGEVQGKLRKCYVEGQRWNYAEQTVVTEPKQPQPECCDVNNPSISTVIDGNSMVVSNTGQKEQQLPKLCLVGTKEYQIDEMWTDTQFRYRCTMKGIVKIACINGGGVEIIVGQTQMNHDKERSCLIKNGEVVYEESSINFDQAATMSTTKSIPIPFTTTTDNFKPIQIIPTRKPVDTAGVVCRFDDRTYGEKEEWFENKFIFQCQPNGNGIVIACNPRAGVRVEVNDTQESGGMIRKCWREGSSVKYLESFNPKSSGSGTGCVKDGQNYSSGQDWIKNNFKYKCQSNGIITILACISTWGDEIGLNENQTFPLRRLVAKCENKGLQFRYSEQPINQ